MAMRTWMGLGLAALLGGCAGAPGDTGEVGEALRDHCPDPTVGCTMTNGTGVYYGEDGFAGIDTLRLMITRFVNKGTSVGFQSRYFDAGAAMWLPLAGEIRSATFKGVKSYKVQSIAEKATQPIWTLVDATTQQTLTVPPADLGELQLNIDFADPSGKTDTYILEFGKPVVEQGVAGNVIVQYPMKWHAWDISNPGFSYCLDADKNPDNVVFQHGIAVNPVTGGVTRSAATADLVTFSCRQGAIATVYNWGYDYLGAKAWYYDSGIQMKRASYCADGYHYTKAGTKIEVSDGAGIRKEVAFAWQDTSIEAYWTPTGATCLGKMRHPELGFNGYCNGQKLQACPDIVAVANGGGQYLVDAVP